MPAASLAVSLSELRILLNTRQLQKDLKSKDSQRPSQARPRALTATGTLSLLRLRFAPLSCCSRCFLEACASSAFDEAQCSSSSEHDFSELQKEPEEVDFTRGPLLGTPDSPVCRS